MKVRVLESCTAEEGIVNPFLKVRSILHITQVVGTSCYAACTAESLITPAERQPVGTKEWAALMLVQGLSQVHSDGKGHLEPTSLNFCDVAKEACDNQHASNMVTGTGRVVGIAVDQIKDVG